MDLGESGQMDQDSKQNAQMDAFMRVHWPSLMAQVDDVGVLTTMQELWRDDVQGTFEAVRNAIAKLARRFLDGGCNDMIQSESRVTAPPSTDAAERRIRAQAERLEAEEDLEAAFLSIISDVDRQLDVFLRSTRSELRNKLTDAAIHAWQTRASSQQYAAALMRQALREGNGEARMLAELTTVKQRAFQRANAILQSANRAFEVHAANAMAHVQAAFEALRPARECAANPDN